MQRILLHRNQLASFEDPKATLSSYRAKSKVNSDDLASLYYGKHFQFRKRIHDFIGTDPLFKQSTLVEKERGDLRELTWRQLKKIIKELNLGYKEFIDPYLMHEFYFGVQPYDMNLSTRWTVSTILYGMSIDHLGTEKHQKFTRDVMNFKDIGCYALTELAHGSNTRALGTRADYDHKTREFIINSPNETDMKIWIGAAAHLANMAVVWAQLYIDGKSYGTHAFIVPIRDKKTQTVLPGITIGDCGHKVGLNGVDNGFMLFKNVRIPYDNFLDKYSQINSEGQFVSAYDTVEKRMTMFFSTLVRGRIWVTDTNASNLLNSLTIASRFACARRQFGLPKQPEYPIIEYPQTQYRLIPYLAGMFAINFASQAMFNALIENNDKLSDPKNPILVEVHAMASALKGWSSVFSHRGIQECREVCGGLGYSAYNRLGKIKEDNDINSTWEGDINVLSQQTVKFLLDCFRKVSKGKKLPYPCMYFLTFGFDPLKYRKEGTKSEFAISGYDTKVAFAVRANYLVNLIAKRIEKELQEAENPFEAWNNLQIFFAQEAVRAVCELFMYLEFEKKIGQATDSSNKEILEKLLKLFAYDILDKDPTLRSLGYINFEDSIYLKEIIKTLLRDLKDQLIGITDAIGMPDWILNSPIGAYDGDIYKRFIEAMKAAPGCFEKPKYWKEIHN